MAIQIERFTQHEKNTLKGFVTLRFTGIGLEIRDVTLHEKAGKRWLQMPAKPYTKANGEASWAYILDFFDKARGEQFQKLALEALDDFRKSSGRVSSDY